MSDRERRLDEIRKTSDKLTEVARAFERIRWMAEQPHRSEAFVDFACTAGRLVEDQLQSAATLLEILTNADIKNHGDQSC